jgi:transposase
LEKIFIKFPADRWLIIEDNFSIHTSRQVKLALAAWPEVQVLFIPKYACWLNLIEPWWKQLRSLALEGRRFETLDELTSTHNQALEYWNAHRHTCVWKKSLNSKRLCSAVIVFVKVLLLHQLSESTT